MQQKPEAFSTFFAETFKQPQVVADYRFRPPYPEEVFTILSSFLVDEPRTILDVGTGSGDLARPCTTFASRVRCASKLYPSAPSPLWPASIANHCQYNLLSPVLETIVLCFLKKVPAMRYQDSAQLAQALASLQGK